ncbi:MAG: nickel insertion protein, partial [Vulcanococcus sp.]
SRSLDRPNLLRLILAESTSSGASGEQLETVLQQQAQIDDATAEDLAFLQEQLRQAGALEVFSQPIVMKKGRLASQITVIAWPEQAEALRQIWWRFGSSLGVREQTMTRWALPRSVQRRQTPWGVVGVKRSIRPDGSILWKPELDDLAALAAQVKMPPAELRQRMVAWLEQEEES